jgi:formylglycine-generating enzyme
MDSKISLFIMILLPLRVYAGTEPNIIPSTIIVRGIEMNFVIIGNPGNQGDTRVESMPYGCGKVDYIYRIGKYEISNVQWNAFVSTAGAPKGEPNVAYDQSAKYTDNQQPVNNVSWYEAAQFCNYLTSGDKSLGAYHLGSDGSISVDRFEAVYIYGTVYVLPTEDEWYKAAYFKPDGSGYSLYSNGQDTITNPDEGWNYLGGEYSVPWKVSAGTQEQNGTFNMMGNVWEWNETITGSTRGLRGGSCLSNSVDLASLDWFYYNRRVYPPSYEYQDVGFRVVEIEW